MVAWLNLLRDFIAAIFLSQVEKLDLQRTEYALFPSLIHQVHFAMIIDAIYHVHILTCVSIFKINI